MISSLFLIRLKMLVQDLFEKKVNGYLSCGELSEQCHDGMHEMDKFSLCWDPNSPINQQPLRNPETFEPKLSICCRKYMNSETYNTYSSCNTMPETLGRNDYLFSYTCIHSPTCLFPSFIKSC